MNIKEIKLNEYLVPGPNNPWKYDHEIKSQVLMNGATMKEVFMSSGLSSVSCSNKEVSDVDMKFYMYGCRLILETTTMNATQSYPPPRVTHSSWCESLGFKKDNAVR